MSFIILFIYILFSFQLVSKCRYFPSKHLNNVLIIHLIKKIRNTDIDKMLLFEEHHEGSLETH